jgi:hypothetical protein
MQQDTVKVFGEERRVKTALEEIKKQYPSVEISEAPMDEEDAAQASSRLEPLTYFLVAYGAHVSATLTVHAIRAAIAAIAKQNGVKTETNGTEGA